MSADTIAALEQFFVPPRLKRIDDVLSARCKSPVIILDGVRNAHNVSAVLRSADAFGIQTVYCVGEEYSFSRGISLGTERWLTLHRHVSPQNVIDELRAQNYKFVVLQAEEISKSQQRESFPVTQLPFHTRLALIFGNEHKGVSPEFSALADFGAHIPMCGFVESLNISVAAAITLFSSTLQPREPLSDAERMKLKLQWMKEDLRGGDAILRELEARGIIESVPEEEA